MGTVLTSIKKIKFRYIGMWLKDQMSRSDWFRNMFVHRSAWGAFSIYAHAKRSDGKSKISYKSKAKAEKAAFDMAKRYGYHFTTYKCLFCDGWHVSKAVKRNAEGKTSEKVALDKYAVKADVRQLHRTDIALCTYWVFYAADKGIAPPPICGYRKDKGLTTNKIMRVLNAVYRYMTVKKGVEPIPEIVFHERKEIIKELSKA